LYEELYAIVEGLVLAPPNSLVKKHLQMWDMKAAAIHLHGAFDCCPKMLNAVGSLKFRCSVTTLLLVNNAMQKVVLQSVVAPPEVGIDLCPKFDVFNNNLS
jgi:hypothetical protein